MSGARLDVVIVSYRGEELLRRCLASLREHLPPPGAVADGPVAEATVSVVDNGGGAARAMVAAEFPELDLLPQERNVGFARAANVGIRRGRAPLVLVLNPDAALTSQTLPPLLELLEAHPEVGCCGPALIRDDGGFDHAARRSFPTPLSALGHFSGIGRRLGSGPLAAYRAPEVERGPVDAVNGAFMLLRRDALADAGLFDEGYWMYMEDLDLCYRLAQAGWTTWFEPRARALHSKAGTTGGRRDARLTIAFHRGMGRFYRRHYAATRPAALNLAVYAGIGLKLGAALLGGVLRR